MCLSKVWFEEKTNGQPIMEDIARIEVNGNKVIFYSLFGESTEVEGTIKSIDFTSSKILLEDIESFELR